MIAKATSWHRTAVAAAAIALLGLSSSQALALSLGRITVQSALGEPLRAEIDVPEINADESASLQARIAPPDAFTAAGLEYHPEMTNLQLSLQKRPDGRTYIRLTSARPINDPFVDMILVASWSTGRIVRDYTMLLDPPSLKAATAPAPSLPQTSASVPVRIAAAPAPALGTAVASAAGKPPTPLAAAKSTSDTGKASGDTMTVKSGDSASKIAAKVKPKDISLDQMLVALLRSNPDAFVKNNLNRLRAGAVLNLPTAQQAAEVSAGEASQLVLAQSKDFNEFRRSLASNAPVAAVEAADRKASGKVEAKVDDKKPASTTPDKLTLSKGALQAKADEAKIAKERADKDAAARAAELSKNLNDLSKLGAAVATKNAGAPAPAASAPLAPASNAKPTAVASAPVPAASAPALAASAPVPAVPAVAPAAPVAAKPKVAPPPEPVEPPGIIDELLADPLIPAAAGGLIALLGGFALYRIRQRKKNGPQVESSFLASRLQPDSFFGASGGQQVETGNETGNSSEFGHSQMDGADDVDPVAEADVYLAYGRDQQAEDILKEALRQNPARLAVHMKLLGIYSKRRDAINYQAIAVQAFKLAQEGSPEWNTICEQGLGIDPGNALYQPGGANLDAIQAAAAEPSLDLPSSTDHNSTLAMNSPGDLSTASGNVDLDLDLDFSADDASSATPDIDLNAPEPVAQAANEPGLDASALDFDISSPGALTESPALTEEPAAPAAETPIADNSLDLDMGALGNQINFDLPTTASEAPAAESPAAPSLDLPMTPDVEATPPSNAKTDDGMLEFDLGSLSLDLDTPAAQPAAPEPDAAPAEDPLETKLALADEFVSIGDTDGARALIEEVVAEATGELRAKAERALANLS